jgi:hypothetical protein
VALVNLGDTNRESAVYVSQAGSAGPFTKVTLAGYQNQTRLALAPVLPRIATPSTHPQVVYVLGGKAETPNLWRIDQTTARVVRDLPPPLFGGKRTGHGDTQDQSWYDMAVAADPSSPADVFIGGSTEHGPDNWEAALYKGTLTGTAAADDFSFGFLAANNLTPTSDPTYVGEGVHADVHIIRVSDDGRGVLVGCDGGVFASTSGGGSLSYSARNTGLAVTECGFVAAHPEHAGPVLAGTQDNGVIRRIGDSVWEMQWGGDGGGVCFHSQPGHGAFYVGQYTKVSWNGKGNFDEPIMRQAFIDAAKANPNIPALTGFG